MLLFIKKARGGENVPVCWFILQNSIMAGPGPGVNSVGLQPGVRFRFPTWAAGTQLPLLPPRKLESDSHWVIQARHQGLGVGLVTAHTNTCPQNLILTVLEYVWCSQFILEVLANPFFFQGFNKLTILILYISNHLPWCHIHTLPSLSMISKGKIPLIHSYESLFLYSAFLFLG